MNIEDITTELHHRVAILLQDNDATASNLRIVHRSKTWNDKIAETEDLIHKVYSTLDEVLVHNHIEFKTDQEKESFVHYLEPVVNDIVIRNIKE